MNLITISSENNFFRKINPHAFFHVGSRPGTIIKLIDVAKKGRI